MKMLDIEKTLLDYSENEQEQLFIVVYHAEGYEPVSMITMAKDESQAWEKVAEYHVNLVSEFGDDDEIYLDHVKSLYELVKYSKV